MNDKATVNLTAEYIAKVDRLGVLLAIKPGGGRPNKGDRNVTNRSEVLRLAIDNLLKTAEQQPADGND